jgi:hypothetical protein
MASIVLRHLLLKKFQGHNPRQPIPYPKKNTRIFLGEHSSIPHIMTTPLVAAAIRTVRTSDSQVQQVVLHNGKVIRTRSTEGASIENPKQVQSLMELEQHLILGSNIINGVSQARSRL